MGETGKSLRSTYWMLLLVPLFWGGAFGAGKHVLTELPPFTTATLRFGLAGLLLMIWLTWQRGWDIKQIRERWLGLLILSVTGIFGYNAFFFLGLQYTSATNGALVIAMNPVSTTIAAVIWFGEMWSRRLGLGMLLSLIGVLVVISHGSIEIVRTLSFNTGDIMLLGAVASWSIYSSIGKVVMKGMSTLLVTTVTTVTGTLGLFVGTLFEDGWSRVPEMSMQSWVEIVYMAAFATVIAFVLWNMGLQRIGSSRTSSYVNLVPINAAWIAYAFYGEQVTWAHAVGLCLVVSGVLLTTRAPQKQPVMQAKHGVDV